MNDPLARLADLWIARKPADRGALAAARGAVSHLRPVVLVTGASRGIGAELASAFARKGYAIALLARGEAGLASVAARIAAESGTKPLTLAVDLTAPDALAEIDRQLASQGAFVNILVNNAGLGLAGPFAAADAAELGRLAAVNIGALTALSRRYLPGMLARRSGGILNVASLGGAVPGPGQAAYYASKAYVLSLSEALASECSGQGVRISVLAPGPVETAFHAAMGAEDSLYRVLFPPLSPHRAARAGYRGFAWGRRLIVPGIFNMLCYAALRLLPHPVSVPLVKLLLAKPRIP